MDRIQGLIQVSTEAGQYLEKKYPTDAANASRLIGWAAYNLGGVLMAETMIEKLGSRAGLQELQQLFHTRSGDVMTITWVLLAARSAVTVLDLCAAAAWRLQPGTPWDKRDANREADLVGISSKLQSMDPGYQSWARAVTGSPEWNLLLECRHRATHRTHRRKITIHAGAPDDEPMPHDQFELAGTMYPVDLLVHDFAEKSEQWFREFCAVRPPTPLGA